MTASLWQLTSDLEQLDGLIEEILEDESLSDDEREAELEALFKKWIESDASFEEKADRVVGYIKMVERLTQARKDEAARLRSLAAQSERQAERLRGYLCQHLQKRGKTKLKGTNGNVSLRRKPAKVELTVEIDDLPDQFKKVEVSPRLADIKTYLKSNECDFARLVESDEFSITIK